MVKIRGQIVKSSKFKFEFSLQPELQRKGKQLKRSKQGEMSCPSYYQLAKINLVEDNDNDNGKNDMNHMEI